MQAIKYMSLVFRGAIEEYDNAGVRPSVFLDAAGDLQIYICDPILDDPEAENTIPEMELEVNGGQFAGFCNSFNVPYNRVRSEVASEQMPR
ncbi:hypothetical protein ACT9XH_06715 [Methanococcoides methylutens]|uniref:hypothetical protein n=1 Tax=Methanococcoides methylutens TaxID=2226 RepID=UPI004043BE99